MEHFNPAPAEVAAWNGAKEDSFNWEYIQSVLIPNPINSKPKHAHDQIWRDLAQVEKEKKHDGKTVQNLSVLHYNQLNCNLACGMRFNLDKLTFIYLFINWEFKQIIYLLPVSLLLE